MANAFRHRDRRLDSELNARKSLSMQSLNITPFHVDWRGGDSNPIINLWTIAAPGVPPNSYHGDSIADPQLRQDASLVARGVARSRRGILSTLAHLLHPEVGGVGPQRLFRAAKLF
jgi:hypothetical protein